VIIGVIIVLWSAGADEHGMRGALFLFGFVRQSA